MNLSQVNYSGIRQVINDNPPTIALIRKEQGEQFALVVLSRMVESLASSLNVGKNMDVAQIQEASQLLLQEYWHYPIQYFKIAFDKFKMNKYPEIKVLDSFHIQMIFQILERFDLELKNTKEKIEQEKKQAEQMQWEANAVPMPDKVKQELEDIKKRFASKKTAYQSAQPPEEWNKTKEWLEDFNKIHKESGDTRAGIKYIKINGLVMDRNGYLVHRLIENE